MAWRMAKSLEVLLSQVNAKYKDRSTKSDGGIGNAEHSARSSDHNPNSAGVVCARDFTNDPDHGFVSRKFAEALIASRDPRIKYVISNKQICSGEAGPDPWAWRKYAGANPHEHHAHVSVRSPAKYYDDVSLWDIGGAIVKPTPTPSPLIGSAMWLQQELNKHGAHLQEDGHEGDLTIAATRAFAVEQLKGIK